MRSPDIRFLGTAGGAGSQTINADYVSSAAVVNQPTITTVATISADYLASGSVVYEPTLSTGATINADYLASSSQVYEPTITTVATISADYLSSAAQIYQPSVFTGLTINADYVSSNAQVYEPTFTTEATINADYLASNAQIYEPTLELTLQTIEAPYLASNAQVFAPTIIGGTVAVEETPTGGWDWYDRWKPTKAQIRKQREELGIIKPAADQITRVIKKVSKGELTPRQARPAARKYFAQQDLQFSPTHEEAISKLLRFLREKTNYNPVEYAAQRAQEAAQQAQQDQEYQELITELQEQRARIEEQDMVFVITCLAA